MANVERADSPPRMPRRGRKSDDPRMIGPWKVGRTIGKGASGRVKIARHAKTGKYAAVKIISKTQLANSRRSIHNLAHDAERILLGMEREIVLMKLIDHPNIMQLYDVYETSGELYLILEYIEGGELFDYICERGRLPASEALDYFQQLMSAVDYCHRFKISHRDLKPENLLLNKQKILKVADFGMAAWQGGASNLLETSCGSPHYAAPEVILGKPYDGCSADIWSCGVILYALLAGRLPFDAQDVDQLLDKIKVGRFIMPPDIDPRAKDLIARMLDTNVNRRIKLSNIARHPWFTSAKPRISCAPPPSFEDLAKPVASTRDIDLDIFGNLRVLWHGVQDEKIIEGLTNNDETWEKIIYHLLVLYRTKHLENYKEELERARSLRKSRKAKAGKANARRVSDSPRTDRPRTPVDIPPRPDPPTPRRAVLNRPQATTYRRRNDPPPLPPPPAVSPLRPVDASPFGRRPLPSPGQLHPDPQPSPGSLEVPSSPLTALMSPASPIWEALDMQPPMNAFNSPEFHDDNVQKYFQQVMDRLNLMQNKQPTEQSGIPQTLLSPLPNVTPRLPTNNDPRSPQVTPDGRPKDKKSRPLSLHIPTETLGLGLVPSPRSPAAASETPSSRSGKENDRPSRLQKKSSLRKRDPTDDTSSQPRTPLGRHVQIVLPVKPERERDRASNARSPISPAFSISEGSSSSFVSGQPKRSWFGNLFNFKPAAFQLLSTRSPDETRDACTKALELIGVHIAVIAAPRSPVAEDNWQGTAMLKCHYDDDRDPMGLMSMTKTVSFRVEVNPPSEVQTAMGYTCVVDLTQEKGAQSTLKLIYSTLRRDWTLDNPCSTPVPILSPVIQVNGLGEDIVLYD